MDKLSTEEKVLNAALKEFSEHGYEGARIDRIARLAKVNKAMIYYHFKSKEALYEKIFSNIIQSIYGFIKDYISSENDQWDQVYPLIESYISHITKFDVDIIRIMLRELSTGGKYFKKIAIPNLVFPIFEYIEKVSNKAGREKRIRGINPHHLFLIVVGSAVFFNAYRLTLNGTEYYDYFFKGDYVEEFKKSLIGVLKYGLELKEK